LDKETFYNISKIIERDSKSSTYKFALLRGMIEIIQENSPFLKIEDEIVEVPVGLMIEKWLIYYYPILESDVIIPQINSSVNLAFEKQFKEVISFYSNKGGISVLYNELMNKGIDQNIEDTFTGLCRTLKNTITNMPMKHIGVSLNNEHYTIFKKCKRANRIANVQDILILINNFGTFSIPRNYYEAFKIIGSFISGQDSILFNWAEFSVKARDGELSINTVLNDILKSPISKRDIRVAKNFYLNVLEKQGNVRCVWTGRKISKFDVDHVIPFSIWKNNDLWNLLPSSSSINNQKRDKIPTPDFIECRKDLILDYWELISSHNQLKFEKEIQKSLLGYKPTETWRTTGLDQLKESCSYLIETRGFEPWIIK
jgi:hypothetical protein